jgi:hypothetical protein
MDSGGTAVTRVESSVEIARGTQPLWHERVVAFVELVLAITVVVALLWPAR